MLKVAWCGLSERQTLDFLIMSHVLLTLLLLVVDIIADLCETRSNLTSALLTLLPLSNPS